MVHVNFVDGRSCAQVEHEIKDSQNTKWLACHTSDQNGGCGHFGLSEAIWTQGEGNELSAHVTDQGYHRVCIKQTDSDRRLNTDVSRRDFLKQNEKFIKNVPPIFLEESTFGMREVFR